MVKNNPLARSLLLICLIAPAAAVADDLPSPAIGLVADPEPSPTPVPHFIHNRDSIPDRPPVVVPIDGSLTFNTRTGLGNDRGSFAVNRSDLSFNLVFGPEQPLQVSLPVDYEVSNYSFHQGSKTFVPGPSGGPETIRSLYLITLTPNVEAKIDDQWALFTGSIITISGQNGAGTDDSLSAGGFLGFKYTFSPTFNLRFGVVGTSQLSDDPLILPAGAFEWKINERTRFIGEGTELRLEYDLSEAWTVKLAGSYDVRSYRLNPDGPLPGGVFRDTSVPITARIEFTPHAAVRLEAWVGVNAYQKLRFYDRQGDRFSSATATPSLQVGCSFEIIF